MKQAKISELKNNLSRYLDLVKEGETIQVLDRQVPVAFITSVADARGPREERLLQMERKGLVRKGKPDLLKSILSTPPPGTKTGAVRALLSEREDEK